MIIGIDGNEANVENKVGVSVYTLNLLEYFQKMSNEQTQFKIFLRDDPKSTLPKKTPFFSYEVISPRYLWSQFALPFRLLFKKDIDVFFSPAHYSPRSCPVPLVVSIHDLSYFYYPDEFLKKDLYKLTNWTRKSVQTAARIISVSKTTKKDITKYYSVPENKIDVIYNGFEKHTTEANVNAMWRVLADAYQLVPQKYILYVGTIQPRKNIPLLIKAFKKFHHDHPDFKLVLTGKKGWLYEKIFKEIEQQDLVAHVIFTDYLTDDEVAALYKNANCFVLPSLYEGFGIPLLEAMSYDCPVISSFASSLPEIGGEAALYFDPSSEQDLYEKMTLITTSPDLRTDLINKGQERIKEFSWERCAEQTLSVIKSASDKS